MEEKIKEIETMEQKSATCSESFIDIDMQYQESQQTIPSSFKFTYNDSVLTSSQLKIFSMDSDISLVDFRSRETKRKENFMRKLKEIDKVEREKNIPSPE